MNGIGQNERSTSCIPEDLSPFMLAVLTGLGSLGALITMSFGPGQCLDSEGLCKGMGR